MFLERSVVVHCSDGWDRTSQLTSLAQLLLDSHYRTISGFAILIEKEWLSFGHKFAERYGHGEKRTKFGDKQRSPIFIQWLDAVFQILMQKPNHFEFTVELLVDIAEHLYSCRFGTFLENNERERKERSIPSKTISLWTWLLRNPKKYLNPNYNRSDDVIIPYTSTSEFFLWVHYYQRWDSCSFSKVSEISLDLPAEFFKSQSISPAISKHQQIKIISQKYAQGVFVPPPPPPGPPPSSEHLQAHSRVPRISPDRLAAPISVNLDDMSLWYDQQSALIGQELQLDDNDNDNELDDADLN